jgi:hypothetical protein
VIEPRLTIELVPQTAWWTNVRSNVTRAQWEKCKNLVKERSGSRCEICGGVGSRYPVDCHEIWEYTRVGDTYIQTLVGLIALCPRCHEVKHLGRAFATGNAVRALDHLMAVNDWPPEWAEAYAMQALVIWEEMSRHQWELNIDYLYDEGILTR